MMQLYPIGIVKYWNSELQAPMDIVLDAQVIRRRQNKATGSSYGRCNEGEKGCIRPEKSNATQPHWIDQS